ncbi:MAG: glycosyltransferase family 4 protein [Solirubrobacteraceae bacterium]
MEPKPTRTALVHDFLLDVRGAERVFLSLCELFPDADLFTAVYDEEGTEGRFAHRTINTSFLQRLHPTARNFRALLPLYPYATEALDLRGYDLVVSSSSAWAHGVLVDDSAVHISYCHNPFRYAWNARDAALKGRNALTCAALSVILQRWRQWDWLAAQRVDHYIANSETTRRRIGRYFNRESSVVYPAVEVERFAPGAVGDYHLVLSELMPHKRIALAIESFNRLGWPLVVIGNGPDARRLQRLAGPTIRFEGRVSDERAAELLAGARALVVTATEEFGIAAVEAQAAGRPVVALAEGGACETVVDGVTGVFYDSPDPESLIAALTAFDASAIDPQQCVVNAARFDNAHFREGVMSIVLDACSRERTARELRRPARPRGLGARLTLSGGRRP